MGEYEQGRGEGITPGKGGGRGEAAVSHATGSRASLVRRRLADAGREQVGPLNIRSKSVPGGSGGERTLPATF